MYRSTSPPTTRTGTPDLQPRPQRNRECPRLELKYTEKNELPILQNPIRIESSYINQMVTR